MSEPIRIETYKVKSIEAIIRIAKDSGGKFIYRGEHGPFPYLLPKLGRIYIDSFMKQIHRMNPDEDGGFFDYNPDINLFRDWEMDLYKAFYKKCEPYISFRPEGDEQYRALIIGHHYGLSTRLLDWTENILVATFFATQNPSGLDC